MSIGPIWPSSVSAPPPQAQLAIGGVDSAIKAHSPICSRNIQMLQAYSSSRRHVKLWKI